MKKSRRRCLQNMVLATHKMNVEEGFDLDDDDKEKQDIEMLGD